MPRAKNEDFAINQKSKNVAVEEAKLAKAYSDDNSEENGARSEISENDVDRRT